jgi:hypothetical protein
LLEYGKLIRTSQGIPAASTLTSLAAMCFGTDFSRFGAKMSDTGPSPMARICLFHAGVIVADNSGNLIGDR